MSKRLTAIPVLLLTIAAAAFAAGRWSLPESVQVPHRPAPERRAMNTSFAPAFLAEPPAELRDIARLPFAESYGLMSSAAPELISRWLRDIVQIKAIPARKAALMSFFQVLIQVNPSLAKELFLELDKENRWPAMSAISAAAPPRAAKEVVEVMRSFDIGDISGCSFNFLRDAIGAWSDVDPEAVARYIEADHSGELREYGSTLLRRWAAYDPAAAREWLAQEIERLENDGRTDDGARIDREGLISSFVEGWFEADREAAVGYALSISGSEDGKSSGMLGNITQALFTDSPDEARAFVLRVAESGRADAVRGISWWASANINEEMDAQVHSPHFVAEWLLHFPSEVRGEALEGVLRQWSFKDAGELYHWMNMLAPSEQAAAIHAYRPYALKERVAKDLQQVFAVENVLLRDQLLRRWMNNGEDARAEIAAVLQRSRLPAAQQQELVALIPRPAYASADSEE